MCLFKVSHIETVHIFVQSDSIARNVSSTAEYLSDVTAKSMSNRSSIISNVEKWVAYRKQYYQIIFDSFTHCRIFMMLKKRIERKQLLWAERRKRNKAKSCRWWTYNFGYDTIIFTYYSMQSWLLTNYCVSMNNTIRYIPFALIQFGKVSKVIRCNECVA